MEMKSRHLLVLAAVLPMCGATLVAMAQTAAPARPLNSLVARSDRPSGPAPAECEQGLSATPVLRVEAPPPEVSPMPVEAPATPPPSTALRAALQETQTALTRNDRPAFDAALSRARVLVASYPNGAERRAAEDVVRLHEAAAKLWDAQYRSPFFSDSDPEYALVSGYAGYQEAVRRSVFTDQDGVRFYPAGESREFVTQLAGERMGRVSTSSSSPRVASTTTSNRRTPTPSAAAPRTRTPRTTVPRTTTPRLTTPRTTTPRTTIARATSPRTTRRTTTPSPRKTAATTPAPSSPNPSAPPTVTAEPAPAPATVTATAAPVTTSSPAAGVVPEPPAPPAPATTTTGPADMPVDTGVADTVLADTVTDTIVATADTSATEVAPTAPQPARGRSVILPTILILIGLGVLIVLFRASK
jgi:hypothetical protein